MSDPLTDLITDIQHNGVRWVSVITFLALYRKERRNHLLNRRDAAIFHNLRILMEDRGLGDQWKDGPKLGLQPMPPLSLKRLYLLLRKVTILRRMKAMERLKSRKFWMAILAVIIPVINSEFGINLDTPTIIGILSAILGYIAVQGHVDAKQVQNGGSTDAKPTGDSGAAV